MQKLLTFFFVQKKKNGVFQISELEILTKRIVISFELPGPGLQRAAPQIHFLFLPMFYKNSLSCVYTL